MTARQRRTLQRYVDKVKPLLGLGDWQVVVSPHPPQEKGWIADCTTAHSRKWASVRFDDELLNHPTSLVAEVVVHELLHCTRAHTDDLVVYDLADSLDEQQMALLRPLWNRAMEYEVDQLARALTPLFPEFHW